MKTWFRAFGVGVALAAAGLILASCGRSPAPAASVSAGPAPAHRVFTLAWTIYVGSMSWPYAEQAGIVKKWADKYGVQIKVVQVNDYVESLNQFSAGKVDAVTATTMDALTIPAAGGRDTTVLLISDYSDGNDGVILKGSDKLSDIRGRPVNLVENSASHYLLARALELNGMSLPDVTTLNTSDADVVAAFSAPQTTALVAWNPQLTEIKQMPGAHEVFDSSQIPDEILSALFIDTATLKANPNLGKALAGIWYETLAKMRERDAQGEAVRTSMARMSGADLASFDGQLKTTHLFYDPKAGSALTADPALVTATDRIRRFSFAHGLFGQAARSVDDIGIAFPGGKVLGSPANVKLRFDQRYMAMAAAGKL